MINWKLFVCVFALVSKSSADNWSTYPSVPKTASINGFADPIKAKLPSCASDCVDLSTGNTPCPYWDTGCLCIMPQWSGQVAGCIAQSCSGSELVVATSLAYSLCSSVGANLWMMPASVSTALSRAAGVNQAEVSAAPTSTALSSNLQPMSVSAPNTTSRVSASLASETSAKSSLTQSQTSVTRQNRGSHNSVNEFWAVLFIPIFVLVA